MKLYNLSHDPNKPCFIMTFRKITIMLDCGLTAQTILNFLPLPIVPSKRLLNLPTWMPRDCSDGRLDGELKECSNRVFIDSIPEFQPPLDKLVDFAQIDVILISNYLCMLALPFITERTGFQGKVYCTEPTIQIGKLFLQELVDYIEQHPKDNDAKHWKNLLDVLPSPLRDVKNPKSWRKIFDITDVNASLSKIQIVGYNEKIDIYGALKATPVSSGFCLGSSNWIIASDYEKIAYVSGSSTLTTHPKPMDQQALRNSDVIIMTGLTQTPSSNPDSMLGMLCMVVTMTLNAGGNVLMPCYPSGVIYDLFEILSARLDNSGISNVPMFFISPVADTSLAYSNILAEWLSSGKQSKVYLPEEPFPHGYLVRNSRLKHYKYIDSENFSSDFRQPCIVFCGHPSLRFGAAVHFIELWGSNPVNTIVFTEPDFPYLDAIAPFQPLKMKTAHCPIDTSLNFVQFNKLAKDLRPANLVIPECYIQPPVAFPLRTDLVIDPLPNDKKIFVIKRGEVVSLPIKRKFVKVTMSPELARRAIPVEVKPGVSFAKITGLLSVKDNVYKLSTLDSKSIDRKKEKKTIFEKEDYKAKSHKRSGVKVSDVDDDDGISYDDDDDDDNDDDDNDDDDDDDDDEEDDEDDDEKELADEKKKGAKKPNSKKSIDLSTDSSDSDSGDDPKILAGVNSLMKRLDDIHIPTKEQLLEKAQYAYGYLSVLELVNSLTSAGITNPRFETESSKITVFIDSENARIELQERTTEVICSDLKLCEKIRGCIMSCLQKF